MVIGTDIKGSRLKIISNQLARVVFLLFLTTYAGCVKRQLIRPTPQMDIGREFWVRVLLLDNVKTCSLRISSPFVIIDPQTQVTQARFSNFDISTGIDIVGGKFKFAAHSFDGNQILILPDDPYIFGLNGDDYRGKLKLILNSDGESFDVVNLVPLEPYLAGVVGAEMPDYWEPAALQAQAIAARTYCLYIKKRFAARRHWDVKRTQANQVYRGMSAESPQIWNAVEQTTGQVLTCRYQDGSEDIFQAFYSSTCGGHTENSQKVFGGDSFAPLEGVPCPYCKYVAKPVFYFWSMVKFDKKVVSQKLISKYQKLKKLGSIKNIVADRKSDYGDYSRITRVKLVGTNGKTGFVRAEDLRLTIDPSGKKIKSTICEIMDSTDQWAFILGRGYGHGVGMCQCGAQGMAREGKNAMQILYYYYPGSKIINVY